MRCEKCDGPVIPSVTRPGEQVRNRRKGSKGETIEINGTKYKSGVDLAKGKDLTVKVNINVSEALKGLKAVQREAKKATQALKEFEEYKSKF